MMAEKKPNLNRYEMIQMLKTEWNRVEDEINANERGSRRPKLYSFLKEFWIDITDKYDVSFQFNLVQGRFIANSTNIRMREDIKSGKLYFQLNDCCLPTWMIKENFCTSRDALGEALKEKDKNVFSYQEVAEVFEDVKRTSHRIEGGVYDIVIHLVKHNFLIAKKTDEKTDMSSSPVTSNARNQEKSAQSAANEDDTQSDDDLRRRCYETFKKLKKASAQRLENGCVIDAAYEFDFGDQPTGNRHTKSLDFNVGENEAVLHAKFIDNDDDVFQIEDKDLRAGNKVQWPPGKHPFQLSWFSNSVGIYTGFLRISCQTKDECSFILIGIKARFMNEEMKSIAPTAPYKRLQFSYASKRNIIRGEPPTNSAEWKSLVKVELASYHLTPEIRKRVSNLQHSQQALQDELAKELDNQSYKEKFKTLLYSEEVQMEVDIRQYDMHNVGMEKSSGYISLKVPGLAENRPSLIIGDRVVVADASGSGCEYEGFIHIIEQEKVSLKFYRGFHDNFIKGKKCNVRFVFNRFTIQLQHRAVEMASELLNEEECPYLCLSDSVPTTRPPLFNEVPARFFDTKIKDNPEQKTAIENILRGSSRPYPYIIFGPPGTGKTVTLVEAMKQVLNLIKGSFILACAPSNNAADLLLTRLLDRFAIPTLTKKELFRLNATGRSIYSLPEALKPHCRIAENFDGRKRFVIPPPEDIKKYRVIVCTFATAGRLTSMGIPIDHFTHVFMDECGQATEPDALIPLVNLINPENQSGGQIVMAGDLKQLGPVLRSSVAIKLGLSVSLLERLMTKVSMYQRNGDEAHYNEKYITKLINNYRSHPHILEIPNRLFYDGELKPMADEMKTNNLCKWEELPSKDFPLIFHGVQGKDEREETSPSFFNTAEATTVMDYVRKLLDARSFGVTPEEIGIISPYRQQVKKLRKLLSKVRGSEKVRVGSVEEFQGTESRIIIISTVRSSEEYLKMDAAFKLGFLNNPKRFNVSVTRAQALLIIVGNPFVLSKDKHWKALMNFCMENGVYKGVVYKEDSYEEINRQLKDLKLFEDDNIDGVNAETPWQRKEA